MAIRNLITSDIYKVSKILKKMNLKSEVELKGKEQTQLGAELVISFFENLHKAESECNEFFGNLVGISGDEFGQLPIGESLEIIKQVKDIPGIANFLKQAGK